MTIEQMKSRKKELGYTNRTIAEKSGVPLGTVQKIFSGATTAPREETILALERLLLPKEIPANYSCGHSGSQPFHYSYKLNPQDRDMMVSEAAISYNAKKEYNLEDYLALPEDLRVELIDGMFYEMAAPTSIHQAIAGYIHKILLDHVMANKGPCFPFISPIDVQLDKDDKTVIQPDVIIVCDRNKHKNGRIFGAPDCVIEVLSPSTKKKDMQLKLFKYANAGVREYWMIDPQKKAIVQYDMENLELPAVYGFTDSVPVLVWNGKCQIDFAQMNEIISFLWDVQ